MSLGSVIGGVAGGVAGFFYGGPVGAIYGASIGFGIGMAIDPIVPDIPAQGTPDADETVMSAEIGGPIADACGTVKVTAQLLAFGKERNEITYSEAQSGGKGAPEQPKQATGRKYYMTWQVGILACPDNPVDALYTIFKNDDIEPVWSGELENPVSGGEETIVLEGIGSLTFYFGTDDQVANSSVGEIIKDSTLNSPLRYHCWAVFDDCYIGETNRVPTYKFVLQKNPVIAELTGPSTIQKYRSNPAHVMWYILHTLSGLPTSWLNTAAFQTLADTMFNEERGICVQFNRQQSALSFLENINGHIDNILLYNTDGQFHPKLIRDDYTFGDLPVVTESDMLSDPDISSVSFIDTINEVKVQYPELLSVDSTEDIITGQWVAAVSQVDTPYVYVYDIDYYKIIRIDLTSDDPIVTDMLIVNDSEYFINHSRGFGYGGSASAQKGGYCISFDGSRVWYLFRKSNGDCKLVEVNISGDRMSLVKTTLFSGLIPTYGINDASANSNGVFFCTEEVSGRIIKFNASDHSIDDDHEFNYPTALQNISGVIATDTTLYWMYTSSDPDPQAEARVTLWANLDFTNIQSTYIAGTGFNTVTDNNLLRYYGGFWWVHRAYYPPWGRLDQFQDEFVNYDTNNTNQFLQNIMGVKNGFLYTLWFTSAVNPICYLRKLDITDITSTYTDFNVTAYCGFPEVSYDYDPTSVSAFNVETGKIAMFRYLETPDANSVVTFDTNLNLISDTEMDSIFIYGNAESLDFRKSISDPPASDPGNVAIQNRDVSQTIQFGLFVDNYNSVWAANNKLQKSSYPLLPYSFVANRNLFRFQPGDTFRANYTPYGISDMVIRVLSIEQENLENSENIIVNGIQDFFSITRYASDMGIPTDNTIDPPDYDCDPFVDQAVFENPYILADSVQVIPVAARLTSLITGFNVYMSIDDGASYNLLTSSSNIQPYGELDEDYGLTYAIDRIDGIYVDFVQDVDSIESETWSNVLSGQKNMAILGGTEIISFQNITPVSGTIYLLENIIRGRWGTVREEHSIGAGFWFIQKNIELLSDNQIQAGASRKFKLIPYNNQKVGSLVAATPITVVIEGESQKPYEPNNFDANGESFNPLYVSGTDITLDWLPRVRGTGAGSIISGTPVVTNTDHEGLFRIEVWVSAVKVRDTSAIDAITWDYTNTMNVADNGTPAQTITFILFNYIVQDGITYESDGVTVICNKE